MVTCKEYPSHICQSKLWKKNEYTPSQLSAGRSLSLASGLRSVTRATAIISAAAYASMTTRRNLRSLVTLPFVNASPADHLPSIEGGRVAAELREADSFAGLFPCRPDGRFGAFRGQAQAHEDLTSLSPPPPKSADIRSDAQPTNQVGGECQTPPPLSI